MLIRIGKCAAPLFFITLLMAASLPVWAQETSSGQSQIEGVVSNDSVLKDGAVNAAVGKDSTARAGSVTYKNSKMPGVVYDADADGQTRINAAIGNQAEANSGSVALKNDDERV